MAKTRTLTFPPCTFVNADNAALDMVTCSPTSDRIPLHAAILRIGHSPQRGTAVHFSSPHHYLRHQNSALATACSDILNKTTGRQPLAPHVFSRVLPLLLPLILVVPKSSWLSDALLPVLPPLRMYG